MVMSLPLFLTIKSTVISDPQGVVIVAVGFVLPLQFVLQENPLDLQKGYLFNCHLNLINESILVQIDSCAIVYESKFACVFAPIHLESICIKPLFTLEIIIFFKTFFVHLKPFNLRLQ